MILTKNICNQIANESMTLEIMKLCPFLILFPCLLEKGITEYSFKTTFVLTHCRFLTIANLEVNFVCGILTFIIRNMQFYDFIIYFISLRALTVIIIHRVKDLYSSLSTVFAFW